MRFRSMLLLALPGLAAACQPALEAGPRVQFVADSRLTTTARRLGTPGDTVTTRIYARADGGSDSPLERLLITVAYDPVPEAFIYPELPGNLPTATLVYLDSTGFSLPELAFQSTQPTRTTAGAETWRYEAIDAQDRRGARSLLLRTPRADSAALYHSYSVSLQNPRPGVLDTRRFLALREGLALPGFSVRNLPANQQRIDLVFHPDSLSGAPVLRVATDAGLRLRWTQRRATQIRSTSLDSTAFLNASTPTALRAAYSGGTAFVRPTSTGPLVRGQVLAFLTPDDKVGLLRITRIFTTGNRGIAVQVRISK